VSVDGVHYSDAQRTELGDFLDCWASYLACLDS
jgi:hypothetical protein